jgi:hypothetical protein
MSLIDPELVPRIGPGPCFAAEDVGTVAKSSTRDEGKKVVIVTSVSGQRALLGRTFVLAQGTVSALGLPQVRAFALPHECL